MEKYDKNEEKKPYEDTEIFLKAEEELRALVRKSNGKDENLTKEEIERRNTLYQLLRAPNPDGN